MGLIRRFGAINAAGVGIIEKPAQEAIVPAKLGVAALIGLFERGTISTAGAPKFNSCPSKRLFSRRMGGRIDASLAPDVAGDYFDHGRSAGELICVRVTDGNELTPEITLYSRDWGTDFHAGDPAKENAPQIKRAVLKIKAKNAGRWGGRARLLSGEANVVAGNDLTETTIDAKFVGGLKINEFAGATITLVGSGKTYEVVGNTADGVFTVKTGSKMLTDLDGGTDGTFLIELARNVLDSGGRKGLGVKLLTAEVDPANNFGLGVYVDGQRVRDFATLSMDSTSRYYAPEVINNDSSNDEIEVVDLLPPQQAITPDLRPANFYGRLLALDATSATFYAAQVASVGHANIRIVGVALGADPKPHRLTFTWDDAGGKYAVVASENQETGFDLRNLPDFVVGAAEALEKTYSAVNKHTAGVTIDHVTAAPTDGSTFIIDVLPINKLAAVGGSIFPDAASAALKSLRIKTATHSKITVESGDPTSIATAPAAASVTGTVSEPFAVVVAINDGFSVALNGRKTISSTLTAGAAQTAAQVASDINTAVNLVYAGLNPASAVGGKVVLSGAALAEGVTSMVEIKAAANDCYTLLGFSVGQTIGTAPEAELRYNSEPAGGHDGGAPADQTYIDALSISESPLNRVKGRGVMGIAVPGVTATQVQKQGIAYAEALNHMFHMEFPSSTTEDDAAVSYVNDTIGRSDHLIPYFPTYVYTPDLDKPGRRKLIPVTGMALGKRAYYARLFQGYHRPAAGEEAALPEITDTPVGDRVLDEEMLTPQGINVIKKLGASYVLWGGRGANTSADFKFHTHRYQLSHYEWTFLSSFQFIIFSLNDPANRELLKAMFESYFRGELSVGAITGTSLEDAVTIKIDNENNTIADAASGDLNVEIAVRLTDFVERLLITIGKQGIFESAA